MNLCFDPILLLFDCLYFTTCMLDVLQYDRKCIYIRYDAGLSVPSGCLGIIYEIVTF